MEGPGPGPWGRRAFFAGAVRCARSSPNCTRGLWKKHVNFPVPPTRGVEVPGHPSPPETSRLKHWNRGAVNTQVVALLKVLERNQKTWRAGGAAPGTEVARLCSRVRVTSEKNPGNKKLTSVSCSPVICFPGQTLKRPQNWRKGAEMAKRGTSFGARSLLGGRCGLLPACPPLRGQVEEAYKVRPKKKPRLRGPLSTG